MVFKIRTFTLPVSRTKEDLSLQRFSLRELKLATDSFSQKNFVCRGGFGSVYRGRLADGSVVAVKRNECMDDTYKELEFQTEVEIGGSPASNHRNVLRLRGYCITRKERLLVYPFMVNRSVDSWLWNRPQSEAPLDWPTRKRIVLGAAKGLAHLHYGPFLTVIHRDIKTPNVLLDDQFEAVISDFGLGKLIVRSGNDPNPSWVQRPVEEEEHHDDQDLSEEEDVSDQENKCFTKSCWNFTRTMRLNTEDGEESRTSAKSSRSLLSESSGRENKRPTKVAQATYHVVCGTPGYMAPDYYHTGKYSVKNDVYGYGVVLLELVTGQRAIDDNRLGNDVWLLKWVKRMLGDDNLDSVVDSELRGDYIKEELKQLIQLALSCTEEDPEKRPVITEVISIIENMGEENVSPNVMQMVKDHPAATTQLIHESPTAEEVTFDVAQCELSNEIEPGINNNRQHDFHFNTNSGGFCLSFKFSTLSVSCVILLISVCINLVSIWIWAKPRY